MQYNRPQKTKCRPDPFLSQACSENHDKLNLLKLEMKGSFASNASSDLCQVFHCLELRSLPDIQIFVATQPKFPDQS